MNPVECVEFLQWALPLLRMRWRGFRRVRSQVCKRIARRLVELDLDDLSAYRGYLESHPDEWAHLDALCRITISRFFRDRRVFKVLETEVFPVLIAAVQRRGKHSLQIWSCGCASGEEAYSILLLWDARLEPRNPGMELEVAASDAAPEMLERARLGIYTQGSLRELPLDLRAVGMEMTGGAFRVHDRVCRRVEWLHQDVREEVPPGPFDLILCRNLVLTYFDIGLQREVMDRVVASLRPGGVLVIGSNERLPELTLEFETWSPKLPIYRRIVSRSLQAERAD